MHQGRDCRHKAALEGVKPPGDMPYRTKQQRRGIRIGKCDGFSLVEVLIALAIAAMLAVVLTRFSMNTRMSASRVRELVTMMSLSNYLLEQTSLTDPATGEGRTAGFVWHMRKDRIASVAVAQKLSPKETSLPTAAGASDPNVINGGFAAAAPPSTNPASSGPTSAGLSGGGPSNARQPPVATPRKPEWQPVRVTIVIEAPSGRTFSADTIRLESVADEEVRAKNN
jgi:prepilin-type N-terminal cleavage/methylation domain-containing protein